MVGLVRERFARASPVFLATAFLISLSLFVFFAYSLYSYDLVLLSPQRYGDEKVGLFFIGSFFIGLLIIFCSGMVAVITTLFEQILQNAVDIKSGNE